MNILVTGAGGFIGTHVVAALAARGHVVHGIVRDRPPASVAGVPGVDWVTLDLADSQAMRLRISEIRPDVAVHFAWYAVPGKYWSALENLDCVAQTIALAQALDSAGCRRLVAAGSCAEYDWNYGFCSEAHTPTRPATLYGTCKDATRRILEALSGRSALSVAWARFFYLYGPREAPGRLVSSVVTSLLDGRTANCSSGEQIRDYLHVGDAAEAVAALVESTLTGPVNVASGVPVRVREILDTLGRILDGTDRIALGALPADPSDPPLILADVRRLQRHTGWQPRWDLETGLADTVRWWMDSEHSNVRVGMR